MDDNQPTSPLLRGFIDGQPVYAGLAASARLLRTRASYRSVGELPQHVELPPPARRRRSGTDPLQAVPEGEPLAQAPSLTWDTFDGDFDAADYGAAAAAALLTGTRRWSVDTQFSVPAVLTNWDWAGQLSSESEVDARSLVSLTETDSDSMEGEHDERVQEDAAAAAAEAERLAAEQRAQHDANAARLVAAAPPTAEQIAAARRTMALTIMQAREDIEPFVGRPVSLDCLTRLVDLAIRVKSELQGAHLTLMNQADLVEQLNEARDCRRMLTTFIVHGEGQRAQTIAAQQAAQQNAARNAEAAADRRAAVERHVEAAADELVSVTRSFNDILVDEPRKDDHLFAKIEQFKAHEKLYDAAVADSKAAIRLAVDSNLPNLCATLEEDVAEAKRVRGVVTEKLVQWRQAAGVWSESRRGGTARPDMKQPSFSAAFGAATTIYEFEREWKEYRQTMELSREEALKVLKQAVLPPARNDVLSLESEDDIFTLLKKRHGNPMVLLNKKEKEVRAWTACRGDDYAQREWLIQAKSKLENIQKMCADHKIELYLHFSTISADIQSKFSAELTRDWKLVLKKHMQESGDQLAKEKLIGLLLEFMEDKIYDCTLGVNLDIVNRIGGPAATAGDGGGKSNAQRGYHAGRGGQDSIGQDSSASSGGNDGKRSRSQKNGGGNAAGGGGGFVMDNKCLSCKKNHSHLFYCEEYIKADMVQRFMQIKKQQACARCLSMKVKLTGRKTDWQPKHEKYCKTDFFCTEDSCQGRSMRTQFHITICRQHAAANQAREADFVASLDTKQLPQSVQQGGLQFLHMLTLSTATPPTSAQGPVVRGGVTYEVIPDVQDAAVFMMQNVPAANNSQLLLFYDSGCANAGLSDRACKLLETEVVREGPTLLDVAGGKCIEIPYGDVSFKLELAAERKLAVMTGLHLPEITSEFPVVQLQQAWEELCTAARACGLKKEIPAVDKFIGGAAVDIIVGIKYSKYFPQPIFSLPSGLAVYRAQFKSASGNQAVLGGPHAAWNFAAHQAGHMNPKAYLTAEARAWAVQASWVRLNQDRLPIIAAEEPSDPAAEGYHKSAAAAEGYQISDDTIFHEGCQDDTGFNKNSHGEIGSDLCAATAVEAYHSRVDASCGRFWAAEAVAADSPYRCADCRNCAKCRAGEQLESVSFKEEAEQALIDASITLDVKTNTLLAELPFISDPAVHLKPNRHIAEKVFQKQLELFKKKPEFREDTIKSHAKLVSRGYVKTESQLSDADRQAMLKLPGPGYFIPWRIVHNEGSVSTPCRMVFDASSKTPGGESLNGVLAKGQNKLVKLHHLLMRFRKNPAAFSADISMAYNGTQIKPEFFKFQKYLWKEDLDEKNPTVVMYVITLIYGVKPSGNQCQASLEKLADHFISSGQHLEAAEVLKNDIYVDDLMSSQDSLEDCYLVATGLATILQQARMNVKAFSFSGQEPEEVVSPDGQHVGVGGYLWQPLEDLIILDIGLPRLGKAKRGKLPEPITGDFGQALKENFTRRVVTGVVARVFDPLGLATPITAKLKIDLHHLCQHKLDWDDAVPLENLDTWVANMALIQELKTVPFKRAIIPEDAVKPVVDLIVAVDASECMGVAAIYGRVAKRDGSFSCQLLVAKSKIVTKMTIPRAEMRSAVMGAVLAKVASNNMGSSMGSMLFVTDSTVCLHWINQDDRPLQTAVRNAVIELRRFSNPADWYHVESAENVADLATRPAAVADIGPSSDWQNGRPWMRGPRNQMPLKTAAEVVLTAEEKRLAAQEMRAKDIRGHAVHAMVDKLAARYSFSNYLVDPCKFTWTKVVRIVAIVKKFIRKLREAVAANSPPPPPAVAGGQSEVGPPSADRSAGDGRAVTAPPVGTCIILDETDVQDAMDYFFKLGSQEVLHFSKPSEYKNCSTEKDGILYFTGRILDGKDVCALESVMFDLNPLCFCKPILDRHSPVAYSIMVETHWKSTNHLNAACTFRESLSTAYILRGRDLAQEVRNSCVFCRRYKAKMIEVEMGKLHSNRLTIAPAFAICQVDLMGPFTASCEHNHRSTVKVWGAVFKDPASGAVFVHAMSKCDTSAFILAYTRFAARFCHPVKLYPDAGSQLLKACQDMEISWVNVAHTLNAEYGVGVEFEACPVGGHNVHGMVERSIKEVKKLFNTVYAGMKLDILGYETAFAWISNELNNLPWCLGSRYRDLDHLDLITPNRLIHGRANKRALSGCCTFGAPSQMLEKMDAVFESWWKAWYTEKLADFVAAPRKWARSDQPLRVGDIVVFEKTGDEQKLGQPVWRVGRVTDIENSQDDEQVRVAVIEYKNAGESVMRSTRRSARKLAVLHREEELELVQQLNAAARLADRLVAVQNSYMVRQTAVMREVSKCCLCSAPYMCFQHGAFFVRCPYVPETQASRKFISHTDCQDPVCHQLSIHSDPY